MISFLRCCTCPPKKYNKKPHHHSAAGAMARFLSHQFGEHWALSSWAGAHSRSYFTLIPSYDFPKLIPLQLGKISILSPLLKIGNKKNKFVDVKRGRVPWSVAAISKVMLGIQRRKKNGGFGCWPLPAEGSFEYWVWQTGTELFNRGNQLVTSENPPECIIATHPVHNIWQILLIRIVICNISS